MPSPQMSKALFKVQGMFNPESAASLSHGPAPVAPSAGGGLELRTRNKIALPKLSKMKFEEAKTPLPLPMQRTPSSSQMDKIMRVVPKSPTKSPRNFGEMIEQVMNE